LNRSVVVTGASGGIGHLLCKAFLREGVRTYAVSRNPPDIEDALYRQVAVDLSNPGAGLHIAAALTQDSEPSLNMLVHNAGVLYNAPFEALDTGALEEMVEVNFLAPYRLTAALLPWLRGAEVAHTVYIGSMAGFQGSRKYAGLSGYSATKAAGSALMESLAAEYRGENMYFNCLSLGAVQTEMLERAFPGTEGLKPEDICGYIAGFALEGWRYFNGRVLPLSLGDPI